MDNWGLPRAHVFSVVAVCYVLAALEHRNAPVSDRLKTDPRKAFGKETGRAFLLHGFGVG